METPAAPPQKIKITAQLIAEWEHDARVLLDANCSGREVISDLRSRGCTPLMAQRIVERVGSGVRAQHRMKGMMTLAGGVVLALVGWWLLGQMRSGVHVYRGGKGTIAMAGLVAVGCILALLGTWKLLTGSAVDVETTMAGTADDELDQGRR